MSKITGADCRYHNYKKESLISFLRFLTFPEVSYGIFFYLKNIYTGTWPFSRCCLHSTVNPRFLCSGTLCFAKHYLLVVYGSHALRYKNPQFFANPPLLNLLVVSSSVPSRFRARTLTTFQSPNLRSELIPEHRVWHWNPSWWHPKSRVLTPLASIVNGPGVGQGQSSGPG
jgi:hypothetical protein